MVGQDELVVVERIPTCDLTYLRGRSGSDPYTVGLVTDFIPELCLFRRGPADYVAGRRFHHRVQTSRICPLRLKKRSVEVGEAQGLEQSPAPHLIPLDARGEATLGFAC